MLLMEIALILAPKYSVGGYKVHAETAQNVRLPRKKVNCLGNEEMRPQQFCISWKL